MRVWSGATFSNKWFTLAAQCVFFAPVLPLVVPSVPTAAPVATRASLTAASFFSGRFTCWWRYADHGESGPHPPRVTSQLCGAYSSSEDMSVSSYFVFFFSSRFCRICRLPTSWRLGSASWSAETATLSFRSPSFWCSCLVCRM